MEAGLREARCSEKSVGELCLLDQSEEIVFGNVQSTFTEDERASFFSLVGQGPSSTVKSLDLGYQDLTRTELERLCVNLSSNNYIEKLKLEGNYEVGTDEGCSLLGNALRSNSALQSLNLGCVGMESTAVQCLMDGLQGNKALLSLDLSNNDLFNEGVKSVAEFLKTSATLKSLDIRCIGLQEGAEHMGSALEVNTSLEELWLGGGITENKKMLRESLKRFLEPLSRDVGEVATSTNGPKNATLKSLQFTTTYFYSEDVAWMIRTNETLSTLRLQRVNFLPIDWKKKIFLALKENRTLKELDLGWCKGLDGKEVQEGLMDLLQTSNTRLAQINLCGTDMESWQGRVDQELRINKEYRTRLRGETMVEAKSGRLILCGYGYAGKTALCKTMQRIEHGTPWSHPLNMSWNKLMQNCPRLRQLLCGKNAYKELGSRTRGVDVVAFRKQRFLKFVWDFAGQREYYALHDYLFPEVKNSCFLYVCSCRCPPDPQNLKGELKSQEQMRAECGFWLKFIASNSKFLQAGENPRQNLPRVTFVMTNKDTLSSSELNLSRQWAESIVRELKIVFKDVVELCETVEVVNAHSRRDVKCLLTLTNDSLKQVLANQNEYLICQELRTVLNGWSANHQCRPVMSVEEFYNLRKGRFKLTDTPLSVREALLPYLNDLGEIIYLKGFDFIVTNPRWFGVQVLGSLIDAFKGERDSSRHNMGLAHDNGSVHRKDMKDLLEKSLQTIALRQTISCDKLIKLMIDLELCFEKEPGNVDSPLFLPALFDDETEAAAKGRRKLEWRLAQCGKLLYLGRRLECESKDTTFLTPGFFPRLQVHLRNYFHERDWTTNHGFAVDRNLICFAENGVEVLVEYSGDIDYFVDILVRSSKPAAQALKFIDEHVVKKIQQFCASPQGCRGVLLVEAVIRPRCVRDLHLCTDRKDHSVLLTFLKQKVEQVDRGYLHTWKHTLQFEEDMDYALDLLEGEGSCVNYLVANQVVLADTSSSTSSPTPTVTKARLEDFLGLKQQLPRFFYPTIEDVGMHLKLNDRISGGKIRTVKLHLMCEDRDGCHTLDSQKGRSLKVKRNSAGYDVPIVKYGLALLWAGIGVATSVASGGTSFAMAPVDQWIQTLFTETEMPIPIDKLGEIVNYRKLKLSGRPSDREILKVLDEYLKIDSSPQWLKKFLDLEESEKFAEDFGLHKVEYTDTGDKAWLCEKHFISRSVERVVKSVHHS